MGSNPTLSAQPAKTASDQRFHPGPTPLIVSSHVQPYATLGSPQPLCTLYPRDDLEGVSPGCPRMSRGCLTGRSCPRSRFLPEIHAVGPAEYVTCRPGGHMAWQGWPTSTVRGGISAVVGRQRVDPPSWRPSVTVRSHVRPWLPATRALGGPVSGHLPSSPLPRGEQRGAGKR